MTQQSHVRGRRDGWTWLGIAVVALAAAVMSFDALRRLAERIGVAASLSWLLPIAIDAAVVVATRTWLASPNSDRVTRYGRAVALASLALSVAGNATEHAMAAYQLATPWWVVVAVSAVPPVMLGATAHLAALVAAERHTAPGTAGTSSAPAAESSLNSPETAAPLPAANATATEQPRDTRDSATASATTRHEVAPPTETQQRSRTANSDTATGGKAATMRATFDRYVAEGRLDELTGTELARAASAAPSLGRRYLKEWRQELEAKATVSTPAA